MRIKDSSENFDMDSLVSSDNEVSHGPPEEIPEDSTGAASSSLTRFNSAILPNGLPYTMLTSFERHIISINLSLMGLCCSISISIYWVALTEIENAFHITEEQVNLTITAYLVFQAVSPVFVSNMSDHYGRRPILLVCLLGGTCANVGLALCDTYWLLMLMRCTLGIFLSPIISVSSSVIGDYTTRRDRGGVSGIVGGFTLVGQGFAPFLGSLFDTRWGFRAIFWFAAAYSGTVFFITLLLFPETQRSIVGNMSHRPESWIHWSPPLLHFGKRLNDFESSTVEPSLGLKYNPLEPLLLAKEPEVFFVLLPCGIFYSLWTMSQASLTTNLAKEYHYTSLKIGLSFFAPGMATIIGTVSSGKILDIMYRREKAKYVKKWGTDVADKNVQKEGSDRENGGDEEESIPGDNTSSTPASSDSSPRPIQPPLNILKARMSLFGIFICLLVVFTLVYAWCSQEHTSVAPILVGSFFLTIGSMYPLGTVMTLMVDLHPHISAAATSMNNLFRCGLAAIFVSCLTKMNTAMTLGGTYSLMVGLSCVGGVVLYIVIWKSPELMAKKVAREALLEQEKNS
ncbi:DEKNAAC103761 [Brettanomyces naardenensis]|uniref:DEKNAAC103761 n=1 Tax=Brettanomyces naardenensis TaxID=13370 RepID=A0A448YP14_BRENA|nr:DEKNAAC103761 [Brettanomyces naardenensis]